MVVPEIPEKFYDLVLRYFDGDLEPAELDELKLDLDWGDMTPEPMAFGGGVGSMFRRG